MSHVSELRRRYPDRVPVHVEFVDSSIQLDKSKYLVPDTMTVAGFTSHIRKRIQLKKSEAIFMFISDILPPNSQIFSSLYREHASSDGMLEVKYGKENTFGGDNWQDWKPVVLKKSKPIPVPRSTPKPKEDPDVARVQRTTLELRKQIQNARIAKKMSQADLAQQICEKPNIIQAYENGKAFPTIPILQKLRKALGVKLTSPPRPMKV